MRYDKFFRADLGTNEGNIGSNLPILESFSDRNGLTDNMLLDIPKAFIEGSRVYIADSYNKRIDVFQKEGELQFSIPNKDELYQFARPYLIYVDKMANIYVIASEKDNETFEIQHYTNQKMSEIERKTFEDSLKNISPYNYYLYKFSSRGDFLTRFGFTEMDPMPLPLSVQGDNLGNIYIQFIDVDSNQRNYRIVRRYSQNGELNFEFNTKNISIETNVNGIFYKGNISSINNLRNDEQLLVMVEYQPVSNSKGESIPIELENIWSSVNVYSILENDFTRTVSYFEGITPGVIGTDDNGSIFYEIYDTETDTLKIISETTKGTAETNFVPLNSAYYIINPYFIDASGTLYNNIIDRKNQYIILEWKKRR